MASLFRPALDLMAQYAAYHRDRRNIATHFIGIPLIVFAISTLLARAEFSVGDTPMNAAIVAWALSALWYLTRGNLALGVATTAVNGVLTALAMTAALAGHRRRQFRHRLGVPVRRPLLRGQEARLRRRPRRPARRPDVRRR
jgi:uncharacterized membrane protein YGL010W